MPVVSHLLLDSDLCKTYQACVVRCSATLTAMVWVVGTEESSANFPMVFHPYTYAAQKSCGVSIRYSSRS